ncbi:Phosphatase dcr2 [Thecaphora frezii]
MPRLPTRHTLEPPRRQLSRRLVLVSSFTLMLTALFYIAHDPVPFESHLVGWQAFESVVLPDRQPPSSSSSSPATNPSHHVDAASASFDDGQDAFLPSFPLDIYAPLLPNPAPITEIAVESCLPFSRCRPRSTPDDDARLGKWVRVERSLDPSAQLGASSGGILSNLFGTIDQRFLFYRKSRRSDVARVVEIQLVEAGTDENPKGSEGWHRVKNGLRSKYLRTWTKQKGLHLYFRTVGGSDAEGGGGQREGKGKGEGKSGDKDEAITELDLVYGDNPAWPGFALNGVVWSEQASLGTSRVTLSVRRRPKRVEGAPPPKFRKDGTFKILQLADLHFSVDAEPCRDAAVDSCVAKNDTLRMVEAWLDEERPDLVVFSGDQLNGQGTSWDEQSVIPLFVNPVIQRGITWAAVLGNHDSESGKYGREEQMRLLLQRLPLSLCRVGPEEVTGVGNYQVDIRSPFKDGSVLATLWFLDSGTRAEKDRWRPWKKPGYGWVREDQVRWFVESVEKRKPGLRPYRPDGGEDLGRLWTKREGMARRSRGGNEEGAKGEEEGGSAPFTLRTASPEKEWEASADQNQTLQPAPSMVFMHIPLPEAFSPVDRDPTTQEAMIVGTREETATFDGAQSQSGFFDALVDIHKRERAQHASATLDIAETGGSIKLLAHGHMHLNEDCRRIDGVWMCFAGGSSFAGYGKAGWGRRARVFEWRRWGDEIRTWHRVEATEGRVDVVALV